MKVVLRIGAPLRQRMQRVSCSVPTDNDKEMAERTSTALSDHAQEALLEGLVSPPREAQSYEPAVVRTDPL